jgi:hypothetical protein
VDRGIRPVPLKNYYLPGDLENQTDGLVDHYNNRRYLANIGNVTPADADFGWHTAMIMEGRKIKKLAMQAHHLNHQQQAT